MKLTMRLTMEGLLRALRWRAHSAAEEIAAIRKDRQPASAARPPRAARARSSGEEPDGQPGR